MELCMRVGDRRLFEIFLDAALTALKLGLHFNRHASAVVDWLAAIVDAHPLNPVLFHQIRAVLAGWNINSRPLAIEDFRLICFRINAEFVVVRWLLGRNL